VTDQSQPELFETAPAPRPVKPIKDRTRPLTHLRHARQFDIANRQAAQIISTQPVLYFQPLMQEWARMVLEKQA